MIEIGESVKLQDGHKTLGVVKNVYVDDGVVIAYLDGLHGKGIKVEENRLERI